MIYFWHIFYGIVMAYFGLISPGMLNMTALKISIENGKTAGILYALGAASIVFMQAGIALFFADFFINNPKVIEILKIAAVFVFFSLAVFFFILSRRKLKGNAKSQKGGYFIKGIAMSSVNMLAIPFYLGISIYLAKMDRIIIEHPFIMLFVIGASLGSFLLFFTYIFFAKFIINKISFIAKNINLILSLLFLTLGIFTVIKILR
jgi:threonine/homoserine/homoserine lactone efflux protein